MRKCSIGSLRGADWISLLKPWLLEVVRRHSDSSAIRFLSYNTFLTEAHIKLPSPFPDGLLEEPSPKRGHPG